jgi:hypothetical protein
MAFKQNKDFAYFVRQTFGLRVEWLGTKPVRLRAWPQGTSWQGWYAQGKTKDAAYLNLICVMCSIPAMRANNPGINEASIAKECRERAEAEGYTVDYGFGSPIASPARPVEAE